MLMNPKPSAKQVSPSQPQTSRPDIHHWWAAEAMIASYNHVYQVTYQTRFEIQGPVGVSIYESAPIASFHYEFLALGEDIATAMEAISAYPIPADRQYVINVFHSKPSDPALKLKLLKSGYEFVRTGPILGMELTPRKYIAPAHIQEITTIQQAEAASHLLAEEEERIPVQTLTDEHIHTFCAYVEGAAAGWLQLVTLFPGVAYLNQLYVLEAHRRRGLGTGLVQCAHHRALAMGLTRIVSIPSVVAMPLYRRLGYRPLLYFSVFQPGRGETPTTE